MRTPFLPPLLLWTTAAVAQLGPEHRFIYPSTGTALAVRDLDGDGDGDVLRATADGLLFEEQVSPGAFRIDHVLMPATQATTLAFGDLDGDGLEDILVPDPNAAAVQWLRALGGGVFASSTDALDGLIGVWYVEADDLDGDGDQDLIIGDHTADIVSVVWAANDGTGQFGMPVLIASFTAAFMDMAHDPPFAAGDLDGDGDTDLVFALPNFQWHRNDGTGTFTPVALAGATDPLMTALADVDLDSDLDIWSVEQEGRVTTFLNDGSGGFGTPTATLTIPGAAGATVLHAPLVGDRDGDGDPDLFLRAWTGDIASTDEVVVLTNVADGTLHAAEDLYGADEPFPFAVGRLDADDRTDVVACMNDVTRAYLTDGSGSVLLSSLASPQQLAVIDHDVVVCGQRFFGPTTEGVRPLQAVRHVNTGGDLDQGPIVLRNDRIPIERADVGDLNGDGISDLVVQAREPWSGTVRTSFWMDGTDSIATIGATFFPMDLVFPLQPLLRDLDGDGDLDMGRSAWASMDVMRNDGSGQFGAPENHWLSGERIAFGLTLSDVDADEDPDFIWTFGIPDAPDSLIWAENDGNGTPAAQHGAQLPISNYPMGQVQYLYSPLLRATDLDSDGIDELLVFSGDSLAVMRNNGGQFSAVQAIPFGALVYDVGDLTGDGQLDVVAVRYNGAIVARLGAGGGTFGPELVLGDAHPGTIQLVLADINADGAPDVVTCSPLGHAAWYGNMFDGSIAVAEQQAPALLRVAPNPCTGSFRLLAPEGWSPQDRVRVLDATGRTVHVQRGAASYELVVEAGMLAPGTYIVQAERPGRQPLVARVVLR